MISQKTVIAALMVSAAILTCLLIFQTSIQPAQASDTSREGYFVAATAQMDSDTELLWLVNVNLQQLTVYGVDTGGVTVPLARVNLADAFANRLRSAISQPPANLKTPSTNP